MMCSLSGLDRWFLSFVRFRPDVSAATCWDSCRVLGAAVSDSLPLNGHWPDDPKPRLVIYTDLCRQPERKLCTQVGTELG
jgi:hypothetical protein